MTTHKSPHMIRVVATRVKQKLTWWQALGIAVLFLSAFTYYQTVTLTRQGVERDRTIEALSVALTAEQNDKIADGKTPVAPDARQIVKDPEIIPGEPGKDGRNGRDGSPGPSGPPGPAGKDGEDGKNGENGSEGKPAPTITPEAGASGLPGANGKDGKDGRDGVDGATGPTGPPGPSGAPGESPESFTFTMTNALGASTTYKCTRQADTADYSCTEVKDG